MASGEGATLETMAMHPLVCAMIPAKRALKPPCWLLAETSMADGGMERKGKERKRDKTRHAVTHYTAWLPETYFCCTGCPFKNL